MANALYPSYKRALLTKQIDMEADVIKAALFKAPFSYNNNMTSVEVTALLGGVSQLGTSVTLTGNTVQDFGTPSSQPANAGFDCDDITFTGVPAGETVIALLLYHDASKTPILYVDTGTGLPINPTNGGDIIIRISNTFTRVFVL